MARGVLSSTAGSKKEREQSMISAQKFPRPGTEDSSLELADLCEVMLFAGARCLGFRETDEMTIEAQEKIMTAAATLAQGMVQCLTAQVGIARVRELIDAPAQREPELGN
jgi:hypothetical protein